jgi:sigma-E factor negative regulatory protein RseA
MRDKLNRPTAAGYQMDTNKKIREYISAFADGELPDADLELALAALREEDGRQAWDLYHRIGDALRDDAGNSELSPGFAARLADKLAQEPAPLRRGAGRPSSLTAALAAIAPAVLPGAEPVNGATMAGHAVAPLDPAVAEPPAAPAKRL